MAEENAKLFESIGLEPKTAANVAGSPKLCAALRGVITEAGLLGGCDKAVGNALYNMATKVRGQRELRCSGACACGAARYHLRALTPAPCAALRRQFPGNAMVHRPLLAGYVASGKIKARGALQRLRSAASKGLAALATAFAAAALTAAPRLPLCAGAAAAGGRLPVPRVHRRAAGRQRSAGGAYAA